MTGGKIRKYLQENGIKQTFIAQQIGIPNTSLNSMLLEKQRISVEMYARICEVLGVPLTEFVGDEQRPAG